MAGQTGRPSPIDALVERPDGSTQAVSRVIVDHVRAAGMFFDHACAVAGISTTQGWEWRRIAGRARIRAKGRSLSSLKLTSHEQRCVEFADEVDRAEGDVLARAQVDLMRLAHGGIAQVTVTEKLDGNGVVTERVTKTDHTLPDLKALTFWLERRFPKFYGPRLDVSVTDRAEPTEAEQTSDLVDSLAAYLADVDAAAQARGSKRRNGKASGGVPAGG